MEKEEKKPSYTLIRIIVIAIILIFLIFLSIGIVRFVPKALDSLASASLSIGPLFSNETNENIDITNPLNNSIATSTGGFSIRELTDSDTMGTISGNILDIGTVNNANVQKITSSLATSSQLTNNKVDTSKTNQLSTSQESYKPTLNTRERIGASDIAVEILSVGIIDNTSGTFIPSNSFTTNDMIVVKFKIENRGLYATGQWSASVQMPSSNQANKIKILGPIGSIPAGLAIVGEARFDKAISGNQNVLIYIDTNFSTQDTNRSNNNISFPILVNGHNSGTNNNIYGQQADLQIRVLSTGSVNSSGQFTPNVSARYNEKAAVRFEVTNNGATASGSWIWRADITGANTSSYTSPTENSIPGGRSATFVVGLDVSQNVNGGYYNNGIYYSSSLSYYNQSMNFNIYVDSSNSVFESNESNNTVSANVNIIY